jgi:hypothetical protein
MSEPAPELDAEEVKGGVVNHLIINGERVTAIIPASVIEALRVFAEVLNSEQTSKILTTAIPAAIPWTRSLPRDELPAFAAELAEAAAAGPDAPELIATLIREWRITADAYADPDILAALTTAPADCGPVPQPAA